MELILVDKNNYKDAINLQKSIFPNEDGTLNILASIDRRLFIQVTGLSYIDDHIKYYLAKADGRYVGITGLYYYNFDMDSAWIGWYGILKEFRNKGLGRELLNATIDLAKLKNFKYIRLYTDYFENKNAIELYESVGFIGEKYIAEKLSYDCRIYSMSLIDIKVPLWNNKNLELSHQSELDQMDINQIKNILSKYDQEVFTD